MKSFLVLILMGNLAIAGTPTACLKAFGFGRDDLLSLSSFRRTKGFTQNELASKLGITQSVISKLERHPSLVNLQSLLNYVHTLGGNLIFVFIKNEEEVLRLSVSNNEKELGPAMVRFRKESNYTTQVVLGQRLLVAQPSISHFEDNAERSNIPTIENYLYMVGIRLVVLLE